MRNLRGTIVLLHLVLSVILLTGFMAQTKRANAAVLVVSVQTDHPVYNPGDTVPVRVHVEASGSPVNDATVFVSVETPEGAISGGNANLFGGPGWYTYNHHLSPSASGGVYTVIATAQRPGDTTGSAQTTFSVTGAPGGKTVDWAVYNPSVVPANPTTEDPVKIQVVLRIAAAISPGPYSVDVICSVDGTLVGGGTITLSGSLSETIVYVNPRRYPAGTHNVVWVVDPNSEYNDNQRGNNKVSFQFTVSPAAPAFDFSIEATPGSQTVKAGQSTTFTVNVMLVSGTAESVVLSLTGNPADTTYSFSPNSGNPSFSSSLEVSTGSSAPPGTYPLTITGQAGDTKHSTTIELVIEKAKSASSISISVNPTTVKMGEPVSVAGVLSLGVATTIDLVYRRPDGFELTKHVPTSTSGAFSDSINPDMTGTWSVVAQWSGNDDLEGSQSSPANFTVETQPPAPTSIWEQIPGGLTTLLLLIIIVLIAIIGVALSRRGGRQPPATAAPAPRRCTKCGAEVPPTSTYCPSCGQKLQ